MLLSQKMDDGQLFVRPERVCSAEPAPSRSTHIYAHDLTPPRALEEIDAELKGVTDRIMTMITGLEQ